MTILTIFSCVQKFGDAKGAFKLDFLRTFSGERLSNENLRNFRDITFCEEGQKFAKFKKVSLAIISSISVLRQLVPQKMLVQAVKKCWCKVIRHFKIARSLSLMLIKKKHITLYYECTEFRTVKYYKSPFFIIYTFRYFIKMSSIRTQKGLEYFLRDSPVAGRAERKFAFR